MMDNKPIEYIWHDCNCMFKCPNCGEELYADSENEERTCECGVCYQMSFTLMVKPPAAPVTDGEGEP